MRRRRGKDGSIGGNISAEIDDKKSRTTLRLIPQESIGRVLTRAIVYEIYLQPGEDKDLEGV